MFPDHASLHLSLFANVSTLRVTSNFDHDMLRSVCVACAYLWLVNAVVYIERVVIDCNEKIGNASSNFIHDQKGNSIVNATIQTFVTVTKASLYLNIKAAADQNDREYRVDVLKTVIDLRKFLEGLQGNPFLRGYIERLKKSLDFELKFPVPPVSSDAMLFQNIF